MECQIAAKLEVSTAEEEEDLVIEVGSSSSDSQVFPFIIQHHALSVTTITTVESYSHY